MCTVDPFRTQSPDCYKDIVTIIDSIAVKRVQEANIRYPLTEVL